MSIPELPITFKMYIKKLSLILEQDITSVVGSSVSVCEFYVHSVRGTESAGTHAHQKQFFIANLHITETR